MHQDLSIPVIAIDGLAGSGKGTTRRLLAQKLGFHELDSGVLYRALGFVCWNEHITDKKAITKRASCLNVIMRDKTIIIDGTDRTTDIRSEHCGALAREIAKIREVRQALHPVQLSKRQAPGLVADGRDMGWIFEESFRFFLTAHSAVRAVRRQTELREQGKIVDYDTILDAIERRDREDQERSESPLVPHKSAMMIDTTSMTPQEVVDLILSTLPIPT